jgi:Ni,Fe-hydrogenase III large subunit
MGRPEQTNFFQVEGESIHEVAVGPVHAGIIEPGHFRFQCSGEQVLHLEISLGYQHRGIEHALPKYPITQAKYYIETVAGDTTIGHTTAHCQALEALSNTAIPMRAQVIRGIALELERLANHTGDLGALSGDVGYQPTMSFCGRLRGDFLNMSALICGNRFGRGLLRVGGVAYDIEPSRALELIEKLDRAMQDVEMAVNLLWDSTSVLARFEDVGSVDKLLAEQLGLVGVPARASGLTRDARIEFPSGIFKTNQIPISVCYTGDVLARAMVRWKEMQLSYNFIREQLSRLPSKLPEGHIEASTTNLNLNHLGVSMVEGFRGEICHVVLTDEIGKIGYYKIVDPSFHNWLGLAMAMRNQDISNFPLCNKSFNLSYCGHDL